MQDGKDLRQTDKEKQEREMARLKARRLELQLENERLKKSREKRKEALKGYSPARRNQIRKSWKEENYQLIRKLHAEREWSIWQMCETLGISRAAYYKWLNRRDQSLTSEASPAEADGTEKSSDQRVRIRA